MNEGFLVAGSFISHKANQFSESVIREMSRIAARYNAVNLAQGFPDFSCPPELKTAAKQAIDEDINQYAITWGDRLFRQAIAEKTQWYLGLTIDPETEITVTCGSTEAMVAAMMATINPGDEVIVFEPFYENYGPDAILCGAVPRYVRLKPPTWEIDFDELEAAFNNNTKGIIINTPNNPTGKVFTRQELSHIARLCQKWNVLCFTDEIYEHILYGGAEHVAMATIPGMKDLTITINALSKTYSITGWRVGYVIANPTITNAVRKVHDFLTIGAAAPLQRAGVAAMQLPPSYYQSLIDSYSEKRAHIQEILSSVGIPYFSPSGAYYITANISAWGYDTDTQFAEYLARDIGVAVVPMSSFFKNPADGYKYVRFCFSKKAETLTSAGERLLKLRQTVKLAH